MGYFLVILMGYLLGCLSLSYFISKIKNIDIKNNGSKNLGASNTVALVGWKAGIAVAIHDAIKAMIAIFIASVFFKNVPYAPYIAGAASVFGHIFPFYLGFKGGKGLASFVGMLLALNVVYGIIALVILAVITIVSDYIVLGTFTLIGLSPIVIVFLTKDIMCGFIVAIASVMIFIKHIENIKKLINGTEMGLRKANKGAYRIQKK
jgi:glycerol-3-phosphate acyltransferase PlsY